MPRISTARCRMTLNSEILAQIHAPTSQMRICKTDEITAAELVDTSSLRPVQSSSIERSQQRHFFLRRRARILQPRLSPPPGCPAPPGCQRQQLRKPSGCESETLAAIIKSNYCWPAERMTSPPERRARPFPKGESPGSGPRVQKNESVNAEGQSALRQLVHSRFFFFFFNVSPCQKHIKQTFPCISLGHTKILTHCLALPYQCFAKKVCCKRLFNKLLPTRSLKWYSPSSHFRLLHAQAEPNCSSVKEEEC